MPLTPAFTVSQSGLAPGTIIMEDTSSGSDVAVVSRRVTFQTTLAEDLVEDGVLTSYNPWPLAENPKSFDVLDTDQALSIRVDWLNVANAVLYTLTNRYPLAAFGKTFFYELQQAQSLIPGIVQSANYFANMAKFWATLNGAINAVTIGDDIAAAQNALDICNEMRENESKYFAN